MRRLLNFRIIHWFRVYERLTRFLIVLLLLSITVLAFYSISRHFNSDKVSDIINNARNRNVDLSALLTDNFWPPSAVVQQETVGKLHQEKSAMKVKIILLWNKWNPSMSSQPLVEALCPVTACIFTPERSFLNQSHVVLFFESNDTTINPIPGHRLSHQRFVFVARQPFVTKSNSHSLNHTRSILTNDKRTRFHFFNWTMTYRRDSDIVLLDTLGNTVRKNRIETRKLTKATVLNTSKFVLSRKNKLLAWKPLSCFTSSNRENYVHRLRQHVTVDVYGKCPNNSTCNDHDCEEMDLSNYKFYLVLEEFGCPDYVTVDFYRALENDVVPVVLGGADYDRVAPPHSFINVKDFSTVQLLSEYLLLLNKHDDLYLKYFVWKKDYQIIFEDMAGWCDLCRMAHDNNLPSKDYNDIRQWWINDGKCQQTVFSF